MKKIVSMLAVSALTLSAVFAADVSIEYNTKGTLYEKNQVKNAADSTKNTTSKTILDQSGYADATSDLVIKASSDLAGVVLDLDPNATDGTLSLDEYYGWLTIGNFQVTTGKWTGRYLNRVKKDSGNWEGVDFERYKPGVIGGTYANDIDNLTNVNGSQVLSTALAYTLRPSDGMAVLFKGVLTTNEWGEFLNNDNGNAENKLHSGLAGEFAVRMENLFDFNVAVKSVKRDSFAAGVFFSPLMMKDLDALVGFSFGADLADYSALEDDEHKIDHNYYEWAADLRVRYQLTDAFALTTMNNFSAFVSAKAKDAAEPFAMKMWNMVSGAYKVSETVLAQLTVENEVGVYANGGKGKEKYLPGDMGGFDISVIPGVTCSLNENASVTAGLRLRWNNIGASGDYTDANGKSTQISIPVVFDVAL